MEDDFLARRAAEEEAKRATYDVVASGKLATVSQLVSGQVVIKPPSGSISPGRSRSPGGSDSYVRLCMRWRQRQYGSSAGSSRTWRGGQASVGSPTKLRLSRLHSPLPLLPVQHVHTCTCNRYHEPQSCGLR